MRQYPDRASDAVYLPWIEKAIRYRRYIYPDHGEVCFRYSEQLGTATVQTSAAGAVCPRQNGSKEAAIFAAGRYPAELRISLRRHFLNRYAGAVRPAHFNRNLYELLKDIARSSGENGRQSLHSRRGVGYIPRSALPRLEAAIASQVDDFHFWRASGQ
jgi:hypothetical protein